MAKTIEKPLALAMVKNMLFEAYDAVHGKNELKSTTSNSIDVTTKGDTAAGEAMVEYLKEKKDIGVVYTEEQGKVVLNNEGQYSVILDDIDGTKNFKEGRGMLPHGSIAGVFKGRDPRFNDCLASGYLDYPSGNFFYAMKGDGCFLKEGFAKKTVGWDHRDPRKPNTGIVGVYRDPMGGWNLMEARKLATTDRKHLFEEKNLTLLPDLYMLGYLAPSFMEYAGHAWLGDFRCSAVQLAMVAGGSADIFVAGDNAFNPNKKRTGEEIGPGYLLVKEAGGAMTDWMGRDIGKEKVGMAEKRTWHYIVAATPELALEFSIDMRKKPAIHDYMARKKLCPTAMDMKHILHQQKEAGDTRAFLGKRTQSVRK